MMRNVVGLTATGGTFLTAALRRCRSYQVGGKLFPGADVDVEEIHEALDADFVRTTVGTRDVGDADGHGYRGIVLAVAEDHTPTG